MAKVCVRVIDVIVALLLALGWFAVICLQELGAGLSAVAALFRSRHREPFAEKKTMGLSKAKEEVS